MCRRCSAATTRSTAKQFTFSLASLIPIAMRSLVMAIVVFGCSGHPAQAPATGGSASTDCEPGRCLENISEVIGNHKTESRACLKNPKESGRVIINFTIDAGGKVSEATQGMQGEQIEDPALVTCLTELVKKIEFAKSPKGKTTRAYHRFELNLP